MNRHKRFIDIASNLVINVWDWCYFMFKKNLEKSVGLNKENLTNYLVKDCGYDKVNATELTERAVEDEAVKIV